MNKVAVICVDDEPTILDSLKIELKKVLDNSYLIETCEDGEEALQLVDELLEDSYEIALVISDYIMPNIKGDELLRRVHTVSSKTLKIMLTGQATMEAMRNVIQYANLYRYIPKPWDSADFQLTVKEAIHSYLQSKKIEEFYASLEKKITQRTQELQEKNEVLVRLNQEKNEFLGIAAHDLKNPLSAIQATSELILNELAVDGPIYSKEQFIEYVELIHTASHQMFALIKNLLDVNAIESGKVKAEVQNVDVLPELTSLVGRYKDIAKRKDIRLHFENTAPQFNVCADLNMFREVMDNLISNAIKYSRRDKQVVVRISQPRLEYVQCEVQDEGPGLSEQDQLKLFNKFCRLSPSPTGEEHSTGLGLFIVKKLVDMMGGEVWCETQLGRGATFKVKFSTQIL